MPIKQGCTILIKKRSYAWTHCSKGTQAHCQIRRIDGEREVMPTRHLTQLQHRTDGHENELVCPSEATHGSMCTR